MVLLRRVIGDALRARRQGQHRTLREVSSAANVSLGYLSEIERGQKEASSELLAAICDALGARLSELLRDVSETVEIAERLPDVLVPSPKERPGPEQAPAARPESGTPARRQGAAKNAETAVPKPATRHSAKPVRPASDGKPAAVPRRGESGPRAALADRMVAARPGRSAVPGRPRRGVRPLPGDTVRQVATDGTVSVTVRQDSPLKATLRATRRIHPPAGASPERDVVCVA
ncbi:helix-turn-helix transcriptional regulator [Micromonospora sp. HM5-17]|jgi:transcriptional regulator with XRE-family HTH domain|uniref:helix-turn-helix domain-containing protein n=1 Tax=Micromonospora sp. HM5-17 TaxID=2487710 RepID=UPI001F182BC9|nr:helix-turn-helix transcriptional regulator [Micromonospora sp. HM5-17]